MATVAAGVGIGVSKLHLHSCTKPTSLFLGKKLGVKPSARINVSNRKQFLVSASQGELIIDAVRDLFVAVGVGLPCTVMECGDMIYRSTLPKSNGLTVTIPGAILALGALSYLWATPGVAPGFFDMFILAFVERFLRPTYRKVSVNFSFSWFCVLDQNSANCMICANLDLCDRMILFWGRSWEKGPLEWFIGLHWLRSPHPRYSVFDVILCQNLCFNFFLL